MTVYIPGWEIVQLVFQIMQRVCTKASHLMAPLWLPHSCPDRWGSAALDSRCTSSHDLVTHCPPCDRSSLPSPQGPVDDPQWPKGTLHNCGQPLQGHRPEGVRVHQRKWSAGGQGLWEQLQSLWPQQRGFGWLPGVEAGLWGKTPTQENLHLCA